MGPACAQCLQELIRLCLTISGYTKRQGTKIHKKNGIVRERMVYHTRRDAAANEHDKKLA